MKMAKKPILTDEALDGGLPSGMAEPPPLPLSRDPSTTRRVPEAEAPPPTRPVATAETSGRDASGHARPKTRILGHTPAAEMSSDAPMDQIVPVVGWLVVTHGPGRGAAMGLIAGMNAVGRGDENRVQLDFGDEAISRDAHAYVSYDAEARRFHISHTGRTNLVRLNDAPVLSTQDLTHGDTLRIGATTVRFVALCGPDFDWAEA
jgi:hypothetical protein